MSKRFHALQRTTCMLAITCGALMAAAFRTNAYWFGLAAALCMGAVATVALAAYVGALNEARKPRNVPDRQMSLYALRPAQSRQGNPRSR